MKEIQKQQGYSFFFRGERIADTRVTANVKRALLSETMESVLKDQNLTWLFDEGIITIMRKAPANTPPLVMAPQERVVTGKITDEAGQLLEGVTITEIGRAHVELQSLMRI